MQKYHLYFIIHLELAAPINFPNSIALTPNFPIQFVSTQLEHLNGSQVRMQALKRKG